MRLVWFFVIVAFLVQSACGKRESAPSRSSGYIDAQENRDPPLWPNRHDIAVCWEVQEAGDFPDYRHVIRERLVNEYRRAGIYLNGWLKCYEGFIGIRIYRTDGVDGVYGGFGSRVSGKKRALRLNHYRGSLENFAGCRGRLSECAQSLALHEMGHAIGLHHEMNRRDQNDNCPWEQANGEGEPGVTQIGDYDPDSIMNYCKVLDDMRLGRTSQLSLGDIATIKIYYEGPWAHLTEPKARHNNVRFAVSVSGYKIEGYRYLWGPANEVRCRDEDSYGSEQPIEEKIWVDHELLPDGTYRLCVIGHRGLKWQDAHVYSSTQWVLDREAPIAAILGSVTPVAQLRHDHFKIGPGAPYFRYKFGNAPVGCEKESGYSSPVERVVKVFGFIFEQGPELDLQAVNPGEVELCVVAGDRAGNWQPFSQATVLKWNQQSEAR